MRLCWGFWRGSDGAGGEGEGGSWAFGRQIGVLRRNGKYNGSRVGDDGNAVWNLRAARGTV